MPLLLVGAYSYVFFMHGLKLVMISYAWKASELIKFIQLGIANF
jgi:hypothetical protein